MTAFDQAYFNTYYGDYFRQNPPRKLRGYLQRLLKYASGGILLDIGCSYGLFVQMAAKEFSCVGMDVDPGVVAEAARRVPGASFITGALPDIPCRGVDVVTALDVLEHVQELELALERVRCVLRPGGIALFVVPVYDGPFGWLVARLDHDPTHIQKRSRQFWLELCARYFEVMEWQGIFRKLFFGTVYLNLFTRLLRRSAPAVIMVLRKVQPKCEGE